MLALRLSDDEDCDAHDPGCDYDYDFNYDHDYDYEYSFTQYCVTCLYHGMPEASCQVMYTTQALL